MPYLEPAKQRAYQKGWVKRRRARYVAQFGGKCSKCGSATRLEFDHVDRHTKVSHKVWSWAESRLVAELSKCQLLCRPCHTEKTVSERGHGVRVHGTDLKYTKEGCRCGECRAAHARQAAGYRLRISVGNGSMAVIRA